MCETWRPVVGYESHYEVSDLGKVRRALSMRGATVGRILRDRNQNGYRAVQLCKNDVKRKIGVHILVCEAFHGRRPAGKLPNHIDLNKHNNRADNLEWLTQLENVRHAISLGVHGGRPMPGAENPRAKLTIEQVIEIRSLKGVVGARPLAQRFGVSRSAIQFIHQGKIECTCPSEDSCTHPDGHCGCWYDGDRPCCRCGSDSDCKLLNKETGEHQ